jgi:LDH2 family malate/lactate/ureidoglycolate dehydrogenase
MPVFKVAEALIKGEMLPQNVGYDAVGTPTQAPSAILGSGALMTFDRGPKSSGLALMVELLANALTGGCLPGDPDNRNWGNLALAIDPDLLIGRESFFKNVDRTVARIRGMARADPAREILLPGESSLIRSKQAIATQELEIDEQLFRAYRERVFSSHV